MSASRRLVVPFVLGLLLLIAAPMASAAPAVTVTREVVRETVNWTLPAGQCPSLPAGLAVSGTGQRKMIIITKTTANGSTTTITNDLVKGTANGGAYSFLYQNSSTVIAPAGAGPVRVHMTDVFVLHGAGVALNVGFNWRWTFTPPASIWPPVDNWVKLSTRGDPFLCDPI